MWPIAFSSCWGWPRNRPSLWDFLETVRPCQLSPRPLTLRLLCPAIFALARRCTVRTASRVHRGKAKR